MLTHLQRDPLADYRYQNLKKNIGDASGGVYIGFVRHVGYLTMVLPGVFMD